MKAAVLQNGHYDQEVGENDDKADNHPQADNDVVTVAPVVADVLATVIVEELDGASVVAVIFNLSVGLHVGTGTRLDQGRAWTNGQSRNPRRRRGWLSNTPCVLEPTVTAHVLNRQEE